MQFIKKPYTFTTRLPDTYQYYKLHENLYQVLQDMLAASEHAMIMKLKVRMIKS